MIRMDGKSNEQKRWMSCAAGGRVFRSDWRNVEGKKPAVSYSTASVKLSAGLSDTNSLSSKKFHPQRARVNSKTSFNREIKKVHKEEKPKKHPQGFSKEISLLKRDIEKAKKKISRKRLLEDIPWEERSRYKAQLRARRRKKKSRIALTKGITKTRTLHQNCTMKAENPKDSCRLNSVQQSKKNQNSSILRTHSPKDQRSPSIIAPDFPIIRDSSEIESKSESRKKCIRSVKEIVNANQQSFKENNENSQDDKVISLTPPNSVARITYMSDSRENENIRSTPVKANILKNDRLHQVSNTRQAISIWGDSTDQVSSGKKGLPRILSSDIKCDQNFMSLDSGKSQRLPLKKIEINGAVNKNSKRTVIDLTSSPILSPKMKEDFAALSKRTQKTVSTLYSSEENKRNLSLQNFEKCRHVRLGSSYTVEEIREIMRVGGGRFGGHKVRATLDFRKLAEPARTSFHKHAHILIPIIRSLVKNGRFTSDRTSF